MITNKIFAMAGGTIKRFGETPIYADYCTSYCIVDDVCEPKITRADFPVPLQECAPRIELSGPQDIKIPSWQRKLVWDREQIDQLITSESSMFGTVILAKGHTDSESWILIDGLQRFSVGTALLNALYDEVLSSDPTRKSDAVYFNILSKPMKELQPVFKWNHERLSNHGRRGIKNSYNTLFQEAKAYVLEKLDEDAKAFGDAVVKAFMIKQVAVDPYSGFYKQSDLIKTFLSINSTGEPLTKIDLLRAKILEQLERKQFPGNVLDDIENSFTDTFQAGKGKYFHDLGVNVYNIMFELGDDAQLGTPQSGTSVTGHSPQYIFPNWDEISQEDFNDFFEYHQNMVNLAKITEDHDWKWPYLSEIFPFKLPYIMMTMYYYKNHYLKFLSKRDEFIEKRKFEIQAEIEKITLHELQLRFSSGAKIDFGASQTKAKDEIIEIINDHERIKNYQDKLFNAIENKYSEEEIDEIKNKIQDLEEKQKEFVELFDELPDFLGGDLETQEDLRTFYRAVMRKVLDGNIGKTEKILHQILRGTLNSMDSISRELNPDGAGDITDEPNHNWLAAVITKSKYKTVNPKIIFNACLLPDRDKIAGRNQFKPLIYKNSTNSYNIDHLIPDSDKNEKAKGLTELQNIVNLAPLEWAHNVLASSTPCSQKLSTSKIYGTMKEKHPYCKWLVEEHFEEHKSDQMVFPLSGTTESFEGEKESDKIHKLDSQVNLLEGVGESISNQRIRKLVEILLVKL